MLWRTHMSEKALAVVGAVAPQVQYQASGALVPASMMEAVKLAEIMCKGKLVPQHLQNSAADCLMVIEQAARWGLSPFAVAQCTSVIRGKLMFEGKLVAAVINARGDLEKRLEFVYSGDGANRTVRVIGTLRGEEKPRDVDVRLVDVRTDNDSWRKQPDQQLAYSGARVWARRHMPELMLGVYAPDEFDGGDRPARAQHTTVSASEPLPAERFAAPEIKDYVEPEKLAQAAEGARPWMKRLQAAITKLGIGKAEADELSLKGKEREAYIRNQRIMYLRGICDRPDIESTTDLTDAEASKVIEAAEAGVVG